MFADDGSPIPQELEEALVQRRITGAEIDQALARLSVPDPAGVLRSVTREDVVRVAIHMRAGEVMPSIRFRLAKAGLPEEPVVVFPIREKTAR